ncbi:MAG: ABC transporter [Novosphingobium sp.]|nr:ABC transporter [Novosphingobium sp.]
MLALFLAACSNEAPSREHGSIGLFTSLPILWSETPDLNDLLHDDAPPPHWALGALQRHGTVRALDALSGAGDTLPLPQDAILVMAQPRPLAPDENVALDNWVRGGGKVLLFADPMLTAHSIYALGDKRRPQDVVLLSPILRRWGLELRFDDEQAGGQRVVRLAGKEMPVNLPGTLALIRESRGCKLLADALAAQCRIGSGEVIVVADAALLEDGNAQDFKARADVIEALIEQFGR